MALLPQDPKKQKLLLVALLPLVLAFLYYNFYHGKRATLLEGEQTALETVTSRNDATRAAQQQFGRDLPRRLAIYEEHIKQLEGLIPRREDVPVLINQITQRAGDARVEMAALNPSPEEAGQFYSRQSYELQVLGDYHGIAEYLTAIGSLPRIVRSSELKLNIETPNPAGAPLLRAIFRIETYIMPDPNAATDTTGAG
ncbi:MAG TPA: type 4a pilus biogenesis protein PilO [Longimicrobiales bacterium]|nr:type 4a pilus biogenesis protein PilO [Longimicrobiales bacterium]